MTSIRMVALGAVALFVATPATAASFITPGGDVSLHRGSAFAWSVNVAATTTGGAVAQALLTFTYVGSNTSGTTWDFTYSFDNVSISPSLASELAAVGFNTSGTSRLSNVVSTRGGFSADLSTGNGNGNGNSNGNGNGNGNNGSRDVGSGGNFNGFGIFDVCLFVGSNCNGNSSAGVGLNAPPATGSFRLNYTSGLSSLSITEFVARFQSTGGNAQGSASGLGVVVPLIPEPATWAMMIAGFGLVGAAMRHRRTAPHTA